MNIKKVTTKVLATALSVLSITGGIGVNAMAPTNQTKGQSKIDELMRYIDLYRSLAYGEEHDLNSINDLFTSGILKAKDKIEIHSEEYWNEKIIDKIFDWLDRTTIGRDERYYAEWEYSDHEGLPANYRRTYYNIKYFKDFFGKDFFMNSYIWNEFGDLLRKTFVFFPPQYGNSFCRVYNKLRTDFQYENYVLCMALDDNNIVNRKSLLGFIIFILLGSEKDVREGQYVFKPEFRSEYSPGSENYPLIPKDIINLPFTQEQFINENFSAVFNKLKPEVLDRLVNFLSYYFATGSLIHSKLRNNRCSGFIEENKQLLDKWMNPRTLQEYNDYSKTILAEIEAYEANNG